ncbi:ubiquitin carboxyl-terminal hydrolase 2-like [Centruroides sculpturatus]|uniref:ubiquitin carboxyl-terminal hydrolase 2-like n=1 Tax=Centruroides sculpturatus TaxID=218467 RepID=UPI000C6E06E7|nr:ubiquitin carboxyl-terminal hydrolase 2-like [Centruroides sculpturatus]
MPVATSPLIRRSTSVNSYTSYYSSPSGSDRDFSKYSYKSSYLTSKSYNRYSKPPLSGTYSIRESRTSDRYGSTDYNRSYSLPSSSLTSKYSTDTLQNYERDRLKDTSKYYNIINNYKNDSSQLSALLKHTSLSNDYGRKDAVSNLDNDVDVNKGSGSRNQVSSYQKSLDSNSVDSVSSSKLSSRPWRSRLSSLSTNENYNRNNSTYTSLSKSSEKESGPCGLQNIGNTCFMNSILQCLAHTKPLLDYCLRDNYTMDINTTQSSMKGTLIREFSNLLQMMWKNTTNAVNPHSFKTQIQRFAPRFTGYSQQDAQEFLRYILQGLHDDVNRISVMNRTSSSDLDDHLTESQKASESWRKYLKTDNSKIVDIFVGQLKSTLKCCHCGHTSVTFDPFWDLSIPISKSYSSVRLSECLNLFTNEEILIGDEMPVCSRCKVKRKSTKSFTIQKFPEILIGNPMAEVIDMSDEDVDDSFANDSDEEYILIIPFKGKLPASNNPTVHIRSYRWRTYNLYAISNHSGSTSSGHYTAFCKNPYSGQWQEFNDSRLLDRWRTYNLYAISNHSGSTSSGHYTAFCKNPYSGQWQEFNDSRVSKNITTNDLVTAEAYILFYEISGRSSRL